MLNTHTHTKEKGKKNRVMHRLEATFASSLLVCPFPALDVDTSVPDGPNSGDCLLYGSQLKTGSF